MSLGSVVAYIVGEGLTDAASIKSNSTEAESAEESAEDNTEE